MGKIIRKVIAVLLVVTALILAVIPASSANATTSVHGEYEYDGSTLVKYLGNDAAVTIPNWITKVGSEAFSNNETLEKIVLPDSVREISNQAFENCKNLKIASIPESVKTIGSSAFSGCVKLETVNVPAKTSYLGSGVFAGCKSLPTVNLDSNNETYTCQDGVIYSRDGKELVQYLAGRPFTAYVMPSTIEKIDEYAFWGASNLTKLSLSTNVDSIPEHAFDNCDGLFLVSLPNSVERINAFSFADCDSLSLINIPDSVGFIDPKAFYMSDGTLVSFVDENGKVIKTVNAKDADEYADGQEVPDASDITDKSNNTGNMNDSDELTKGENTNQTGDQVAASTTNSIDNINYENSEVNNPKYNGSYSGGSGWVNDISNTDYTQNTTPGELASTKIVGGNAFVFLPGDTNVNDGYNLNSAEDEDFYAMTSAMYPDASGDETILGSTYCSYLGSDNNVNIPSGIRKIGNRAFYDNSKLQTVTIPTGVEEIGDFAFARSGLTSISIPNGTKSIDYGAFYNCASLVDVIIPNSVDDIKLGAFNGTSFLANWKYDDTADDFLIVGDGVLLAYKGNDSYIHIPPSVKHIAAGAFSGNNNISAVNIPPSVNDIGEEAFNNCTNLKELILNEGLYDIDDRAFKNTALNVVYIPDSVRNIGLGAFDLTENKNSLETVIFAGKDLPDVSFDDTATRMSAENLRSRAFEGVRNAIIEDHTDINSGTIFDPVHLGFAGQIYSVDSNSKTPNALILERALTQPDENGQVIIEPNVNVGSENYVIDNVKESAFDSYMNWGKWCNNKPSMIKINGNSSEKLDNLLLKVNNDLISVPDDPDKGVKVNLTSNIFPMGSLANAAISDSDNGFILNVGDNSEDKQDLINAYFLAYGSYPDLDTTYLSLDLYDKTGTVPIHKLGSNKLEVALPVPSALVEKDGLKVACLDDNGILTELSSEITNFENKKYIDFVTGHCSAYMIYSQSIYSIDDSEISVDIEDSNKIIFFGNTIMKSLQKEVTKGFEIKWFVIIILLSLAGILFLYKPGKKKNG